MSPGLSAPVQDLNQPKRSGFRVYWKWSLLAIVLLVIWGMWQCGSALALGTRLADASVEYFHGELNAGQYQQIYDEAPDVFSGSESGSKDEGLRFLKKVHDQLGNATQETRNSLFVNATTDGTIVSAEYDTTFEKGSAVETFRWLKNGDSLKLIEYSIRSKDFFQ